MSVLIKGMEMQKTCNECPFVCNPSYFADAWCELLNKHFNMDDSFHKIADFCPLTEIPSCGRLGDLDALYAEISNGNKAYNGIDGYDGEYPNIANVDDCLEAIKYADTIIETEGENI